MKERTDDTAVCPQCEWMREKLERLLQQVYTHEWLEKGQREQGNHIHNLLELHKHMVTPSPLTTTITWIPVSERMPEDDRTKLIICGPYIVMAHWNPQFDLWAHGKQQWDPKHVTHWAELPTPPAGEEVPA